MRALPSGRPLLSKCELPIARVAAGPDERRSPPRALRLGRLRRSLLPARARAAAVQSRHRAANRAPTDERAGHAARTGASVGLLFAGKAARWTYAGGSGAALPAGPALGPHHSCPSQSGSPSRTRPQMFPPRASPPLRVPGTAPLPLLGAVTQAGVRVLEQPIRVGRYRSGCRGLQRTARGAHPA
ncbi:hypothetical protein STEG23_002571 [Scotinomys teguina]